VLTNLVVNTEGLIGVLNQLVDGEGSVIGLNNGVRDLGRGYNGESSHHAVGELLSDLRDQKSTHTGTGATTEGVGNLKALKAVAALSLTTDDIKYLVDELGTFGVVTLCPVVTSARLAEDEVVGAEKLTERPSANGIHGAGLEIDKNSTGDELVTGCLQKL